MYAVSNFQTKKELKASTRVTSLCANAGIAHMDKAPHHTFCCLHSEDGLQFIPVPRSLVEDMGLAPGRYSRRTHAGETVYLSGQAGTRVSDSARFLALYTSHFSITPKVYHYDRSWDDLKWITNLPSMDS